MRNMLIQELTFASTFLQASDPSATQHHASVWNTVMPLLAVSHRLSASSHVAVSPKQARSSSIQQVEQNDDVLLELETKPMRSSARFRVAKQNMTRQRFEELRDAVALIQVTHKLRSMSLAKTRSRIVFEFVRFFRCFVSKRFSHFNSFNLQVIRPIMEIVKENAIAAMQMIMSAGMNAMLVPLFSEMIAKYPQPPPAPGDVATIPS